MELTPIRIRATQTSTRSQLTALALAALALGAACQRGGGGDDPAPASGDSITESLNGLGIDTSESPRLADDGGLLPDDFSPLGRTLKVDPLMELYVGGIALPGSTSVATLLEDFGDYPPDALGTIAPHKLFEQVPGDAPWWPESLPAQSFRTTKRAVTTADLDGDGIDEIVTAFVEAPMLSLQFVRRTDAGFETSESTLLFNTAGITNVAIAAGDFDGDTIDDLAVGYSANGLAFLLRLRRDDADSYSIEPDTQTIYYPDLSNSSMQLILRAGNLDDDDPLELVALLDETSGNASAPNMTSRYAVLDDRNAGYEELRSGFVEGFETDVGLHVAAVADVALGNIDGDSRDEIVFGGLAYLDHNCSSSPYVFVALDDAVSSFASLGAKRIDVDLDGCANGPQVYELRFVHVRTLDLDGDGVAEVLGNQLVFEDWLHAAPWTLVPEYSLSSREIVDESGQEWSDQTNCAIAVGDVTADGRDDILIYRSGKAQVRVFSLESGQTHVQRIGQVKTVLSLGLTNPVLLTVNVDKDTKIVRATGMHRFLYLEPIVAAVLASPPCRTDGTQNSDVCQSTFGNTNSSGTEFERSASCSVAGMFGFKIQTGVAQTEVELTQKLSAKLTLSHSKSYTLEKSVIFTTGPAEDTVVFTTVPVDLYEYQILQHPDPTYVGEHYDAVLPREPIYLQVERGYYNAHVPEGSMLIGPSVFTHRIGDPSSYPTRAQKDAKLAQYGGLEIGSQSVGQGAGQTELQLVVGEEWSEGGELELGYEIEAKTTIVGLDLGLTVGSSTTDSIKWTSGVSTTYDGVVGSIDAAHFQHDQYRFGLFTYPQYDSSNGQQFEVINYWVE